VKTIKTINPLHALATACREALTRFWGEQLAVEPTRTGVALALPLMYPDGLQAVIEVQPISATRAVVSDQGHTLTQFFNSGFNVDARAKQTHTLLQDRIKAFELIKDGFELKKEIKLPVDGIDLHLFGEALVSISHLIYRHEPESFVESAADRTVRQVFKDRKVVPLENVALDGRVEKKIKVDYLVTGNRRLAMEVIKRRGSDLGYIERWAWRWTDLKNQDDTLLNAMVYDPDVQNYDQTALEIGRSVCDVFCPYFETDRIHKLVQRTLNN
jgi:hypothetical protein